VQIDQTRVVLVRPAGAANLGAVARALKNFGMHRLCLVQSRIGSWTDAWRMAVRAREVLEGATAAASVDDAIAGATWVVGTTNRPLAGRAALTPRQVAELAPARGAPTLLFGCEESGLCRADLLRCHDLSTIPAAPAQPSLNLAQAVVVYAAELFHAARQQQGSATIGPAEVLAADASMLQHLERALGAALAASAWAEKCRAVDAVAELVQPLRRARLSEAEVRAWLVALHRIVRPKARATPTE
jgi:TrmH family RNA methyltransferase